MYSPGGRSFVARRFNAWNAANPWNAANAWNAANPWNADHFSKA
jgi:hypothetical protein